MVATRAKMAESLVGFLVELAGVAVAAGLNLADGVAGIGAGTWTVGLERCCRVCFSSAVRSRREGVAEAAKNLMRARLDGMPMPRPENLLRRDGMPRPRGNLL